MCPNTCVAFTGPFKDRETCPICLESRYDLALLAKGVRSPRQQFNTFPVGPQLQAQYRSPESATEMGHRDREMQKFMEELQTTGGIADIKDLYYGTDFWDAYQRGDIKRDDVVLLYSMDGAQLYEHKASHAWIYIWIIADLAPDARYKKKHILP
ncbi:hypothetical protein OF83DRAFT_1058225, partial [Amylostereum chailletii]